MAIDPPGKCFLVLDRVGRFRQCLIDMVENKDLDLGLRLFLFCPLLQRGNQALQFRQQFAACLLDQFALGFVQRFLTEQIEQCQLLFAQPQFDSAPLLCIEAIGQVEQPGESILDGGPILVGIVGDDDFLIFFLLVHAQRVFGQPLRQFLLNDLANICDHARLAFHFPAEFVAQLFQVDLREIDRQPLCLIGARSLRGNCLIDDTLQHLEQRTHIGCIASFAELPVNRLDVVVALGMGQHRRLDQQRLKAAEKHPRQNLETVLRFVMGIDRLDRICQPPGFA